MFNYGDLILHFKVSADAEDMPLFSTSLCICPIYPFLHVVHMSSFYLQTNLETGEHFFPDINGIRVRVSAMAMLCFSLFFIKMDTHKRRADMGTNGNYVPLSTMISVESKEHRVTLHTDTPLGASSLKPVRRTVLSQHRFLSPFPCSTCFFHCTRQGELELMISRTHSQDDNLGMGEAIAKELSHSGQVHMFCFVIILFLTILQLVLQVSKSGQRTAAFDPLESELRTNDALQAPLTAWMTFQVLYLQQDDVICISLSPNRNCHPPYSQTR